MSDIFDPPNPSEIDESASTVLRDHDLADDPFAPSLDLKQAKAVAAALATRQLMRTLPQRYQVVRTLATGATSVVVEARDQEADRRVAIKILKRQRGSAKSLFGRFLREWEVIHSLEHPHIVRGLDYQNDNNVCYIVMEYISGGSLQQLIAQDGPVPPGRAARFILQASSALAEAHGAGVIHRDVKPANLLIDAGGSIKLTDFGVARFDTLRPSLTLQFGENVLGTVNYMAPEQAFDSHMVDCRADIYSLGCTLYFLLSGRPPFDTGSAHQRLLSHRNETPPPIEQFRDDIPDSLLQICNHMLAKLPGERFESAEVVLQELAAWMGENRSLCEPLEEADSTDSVQLTLGSPQRFDELGLSAADRHYHLAGADEDRPTAISSDGLWDRVLLVDDSLVERRLAAGLLHKNPDLQLSFASNGAEALRELRETQPTLIVTDLVMPGLDGLQLLRDVRRTHPQLPVIVMTAYGSERTALDALRQGAASYVPKSQLATRLLPTVNQVLARVAAERTEQSMLAALKRLDCEYTLENDPALIPPLVNVLQQTP